MRFIHTKRLLRNILFLDIETASCVADYQALGDQLRLLWDKKANTLGATELKAVRDLFFERAAIYAEFGKIIAIGLGLITFDENDELILRIKGLSNHDEKALLQGLRELLETQFQQDSLRLCAHNGKEFDFPYLCRRMLVHGISLPQVLDTAGKKPWEVKHLDTMEMWKFGDRKNFTSLHLLATLFNIASSKESIDGSKINHYYYIKNDLDGITRYCMQDVAVTAQVFLRLNCWEPVKETNIIFN